MPWGECFAKNSLYSRVTCTDLERGFAAEAVMEGDAGDCGAGMGGGPLGSFNRGMAPVKARGGGLGPELLACRPGSLSVCFGMGAGAGAGAPDAGAASCDEDEVACAGAFCLRAVAAMCVGAAYGSGGAVAVASVTDALLGGLGTRGRGAKPST